MERLAKNNSDYRITVSNTFGNKVITLIYRTLKTGRNLGLFFREHFVTGVTELPKVKGLKNEARPRIKLSEEKYG